MAKPQPRLPAAPARLRGENNREPKGAAHRFKLFLLLTSGLLKAVSGAAYAQALPQGGTVSAGDATISANATNVTIDQASQSAIINWQSFDIAAGQSVTFNQPGASAATLNRVTGGTPSLLSGSLFAPGAVYLINPNGIGVSSTGRINVGTFAASTLDISDEDFLAGRFTFSGDGGVVTNRGHIDAQNVALLGGAVRNEGVVTAELGRVVYAAGDLITIDFGGDSLVSLGLSVADLEGATDVFGTSLDALVSVNGVTRADGGRIHILASSAESLALASVRVGGEVRARSVRQTSDGGVLLSSAPAVRIDGGEGEVLITGAIDASSRQGLGGSVGIDGAFVALGGVIDVSGRTGGRIEVSATNDLSLAGAADAHGAGGGGHVVYEAGRTIIENSSSTTDVSSDLAAGGTVRVSAESHLVSSGAYDASGAHGGSIDISAASVTLLSAQLDASGVDRGGSVRVGGAFQGGRASRTERDDYAAFEGRFDVLPALRNAQSTFINDGAFIDVSAQNGAGGAAIVWSDQATTMLGHIDATGLTGGNVEISSAGVLRQADLLAIDLGAGGALLLDPANILIGDYAAASSWTYSAIIGVAVSGGPGVDAYAPPDVSSGELFGYSVALNGAGDRLAVGGPNDAGFGDGTGGAGAVRLFTFTDGDFNGAALAGTVGRGYVGAGNVDIALTVQDNFGTSVALNALGDRLAVGATGDDGQGNAVGNAGAVYLFSFGDGDFGGGALMSTIGSAYSGPNDLDVTLDIDDGFGRAVSLNAAGDRLAVGIRRDAGADNTGSQLGAVQLFTFTDANFSDPALAATIGRGYGGANDYNLALENSDFFGVSVSLNAAGDMLAVGALGDDGLGNIIENAGAVRLFTFADSSFGGIALAGTMGAGYAGAGDINVAALTSEDEFGSAVSLNALGDRIAVGARGDDGFGNLVLNSGAVRLYRFLDAAFGGGALEMTIGQGYAGPNDVNMSVLPADVAFGHAVALNGAGDRVAVGAERENLANAVWLFTSAPNATGDFLFGDNPAGVSLVSRAALAATLATGASVTLEANSDITLEGDLIVDAAGVGGDLELSAGRSILLGDNAVATDGGDLTLHANASVADGVVDAHRAAGAAQIVMAAGGSIDAGSGAVVIEIGDGAGLSHSESGDITLASISASSISVRNAGLTAGSDVNIQSGATLQTTDTGVAMSIATDNGTFANFGALNPTNGGFYAVWADAPLLATEGVSGFIKRYGIASFAAFSTFASSANGNVIAYRLTPTLDVTALAQSQIYGEADPALAYALSGLIDGDTELDALTGALSRDLGDDVGIYSILQGTLTATELGYAINFTGADLSITPRPISVIADDLTRIYGETDPALTYTIGGMGLASGDGFAGALARDSGENVGFYNILQGTLALTSNYDLTFVGGQLQITPRPIIVTADDLTRIYGEADLALTYTVGAMGLALSDAFAGALSRNAGENVGFYDITQGSLALSSNYDLTFNAGQLQITPRAVIVTADDLTRIYGESDPALTYVVSGMGLALGDAFTGGLTRAVGENVGFYDILQGALALSSNYDLTFFGGQLQITPRPIIVTADDFTRIYGETDPALTYAISGMGLALGDAFAGSLARDAGENVGFYDIGQGTLALSSNYDVTFNGGQLQITPRSIVVTADDLTRIYGESDPALTYAFGGMGLALGDTFTGGLARDAGENVGFYNILQGTLALTSNYDLTFVGGQLQITPRPIIVTADDLTRIYGETDPALTYVVGGLGLALGDAFTGALARDAGENAGFYNILQGTLALSSNYDVTFNGGQLQITPRPIIVTADDLTRIYGDTDPALTYIVGGMGLALGDVITGGLTRAAGENVGLYTITQGTLAVSSNYDLTFDGGQFQVTPRPITVAADDLTRLFNHADPALTWSITQGNLVFADALSGALTRATGELPGLYAILQGTLGNSNYLMTYVQGTLTIEGQADGGPSAQSTGVGADARVPSRLSRGVGLAEGDAASNDQCSQDDAGVCVVQ